MTISAQLCDVVTETSLQTDRCNACQRQGLPILPLRKALVPRSSQESNLLTETRLGVRTLRAGYLYVLLDQKIWQAYQVTPDGYLRQFNPYAPPAANETLLCDTCISSDHDAPASFLNIDARKYSIAQLAFAGDPWPRSVLDAYRARRAPERFRTLDLTVARNNPGSLEDSLVMTPDNPRVNQEVYEYTHQQQPIQYQSVKPIIELTSLQRDFRFYALKPQPIDKLITLMDSAHGFHSRVTRVQALKRFLGNTIEHHALEQGVLALVLDDPVGLVQEYNHLRNGWIGTRQKYIEEPLTAYKQQTSQLLLLIRAMHRQWAEQETPLPANPSTPYGYKGVYSRVDESEQAQAYRGKLHEHIVQKKTLSYNESLEERYHEADRAAFEASYNQQLAYYQRTIDSCAQAYAHACRSTQFACIEQNDYDGDDAASGRAYCQTLSLCLAGGISEATAISADSTPDNDTGPSAMLWHEWLKNPQSPIYRALLLRNQALLAGLLPSFNATGDTDWNDSEKLYSALTRIVTSDEATRYMRPGLQQANALLIGALNAASTRLQPVLGPGVARVVSRLNSATQLLYNGIHLTELKVRMKLSEYYALQCEHLRSLQRKASDAISQSAEGVKESLGKVSHEERKVRRNVIPMIQGGLLSLAVLDPKLADQMITVSVWVEGEVEKLQRELISEANHAVNRAGKGAQDILEGIVVAVGSLDPKARKLLDNIKISSRQAANWVRTGFTGLRGIAGSGELLLALGGMYLLAESLKKNLEEVEQTTGDKSLEARMALQGSTLGVLGGSVEIVGKALEVGAAKVQQAGTLSARAAGKVAAAGNAGAILVRTGAVVGAVAGLFDATQAGMAANRALKSGDIGAANLYVISMTSSGIGVGFGIYAAAMGANALLGPIGIAIALGLLGYGLYKFAEGRESSPLELWAKRCFFGRANETPKTHWNTPQHAHIAIAELNAATLGINAGVDFRSNLSTQILFAGGPATISLEQRLQYRLSLPYFNSDRSAYHWTLSLHREGDGPSTRQTAEIAAKGSLNSPITELNAAPDKSKPPKSIDYVADNGTPTSSIRTIKLNNNGTMQALDITGVLILSPGRRFKKIEASTLSLTYWPDRDVLDGYATLTLTTAR